MFYKEERVRMSKKISRHADIYRSRLNGFFAICITPVKFRPLKSDNWHMLSRNFVIKVLGIDLTSLPGSVSVFNGKDYNDVRRADNSRNRVYIFDGNSLIRHVSIPVKEVNPYVVSLAINTLMKKFLLTLHTISKTEIANSQ